MAGQATAADQRCAATPPRRNRPCSKWPTCGMPRPFGGGWPGHGFNNDTACREYSQKLQAMGKELGIEVDLADAMVTDDAGVARFIEAAKAQRPDALMILPMGIFSLWDRAERIFAALDLPTLVFTPIGTSFTMNTAPIAHKPGFHLTSSLDIGDVRPGLEWSRPPQTSNRARCWSSAGTITRGPCSRATSSVPSARS